MFEKTKTISCKSLVHREVEIAIVEGMQNDQK